MRKQVEKRDKDLQKRSDPLIRPSFYSLIESDIQGLSRHGSVYRIQCVNTERHGMMSWSVVLDSGINLQFARHST